MTETETGTQPRLEGGWQGRDEQVVAGDGFRDSDSTQQQVRKTHATVDTGYLGRLLGSQILPA